MKKLIPLLFSFLLFSCKNEPVKEADLHYLNGYWEIAEVEFPDGSIKEYGMNANIDFIQFEDGKGYRKKMQPKFDGTFDTSDDTESYTLSPSHESYILHYKNDFSEWEETLTKIDSLSFSVINPEGITYSYKRFEPIKIPK